VGGTLRGMDKHELAPDNFGYYHPATLEQLLWCLDADKQHIYVDKTVAGDIAERIIALEQRA